MRKILTLAACCTALITAADAFGAPLGSEWTYQGKVELNGSPVNGTADFEFSLWDDAGTGAPPVGGTQIGSTLAANNVTVASGLFTVPLDFGASAFNGDKRWLEIAVRSPAGGGVFTTLSPRQPLTAAPYAIQTRGVFVDDAGNVGIGTGTPLSPLHVREGSAGTITPAASASLILERSSHNYLHLYSPDNRETGLLFGGDTVDVRGGVVFNSAATADGLQFRAGGNTTRAVIDSTGRMGLGTTAPAADLHVRGQSSPGSLMITPNTADSSSQITLTENTSGSFAMIMRYDGTVNQLHFLANNGGVEAAPVVSIARSSNPLIGIGTTAPGSPLTVAGDITAVDGTGVETIRLDAATGSTGGGALLIKDENSVTTVEIEGSEGVGGGSYMKMWNSDAIQSIELDADEVNGAAVRLKNNADQTTIELLSDLNGEGRVICDVVQINGGSDLSEQFDVGSADSAIEPGMVVSIDPAGSGGLMVCREAYDRKVAGVISGAGGVKPGMLMGQTGSIADGRYPVALTGRVWARVDAGFGSIVPGDLLTTSETPGLAMKVGDYDKARGAVIGKAMTGLENGKGLVLVLVQPQ